MQANIALIFANITSGFFWKLVWSIVLTGFAFLFGVNLNSMIGGLVVLMVFDFTLGVSAAWYQGKEINPKCAFRSPLKLLVYGIMIAAAHLTEVAVLDVGVLEQGMIIFLCATEFISIVRNAGLLGFAIPQKLLNLVIEVQQNYE